MRKQHLTHEYMGVTIWRKTSFGSALRWSALGGYAADTLAGIKALIQADKKGGD